MKNFNRRMWENVLNRRFINSDGVEISTVNETQDGNYYGEFLNFSINGIQYTHYYYCDNQSIHIFNTKSNLYLYILKTYNIIKWHL